MHAEHQNLPNDHILDSHINNPLRKKSILPILKLYASNLIHPEKHSMILRKKFISIRCLHHQWQAKQGCLDINLKKCKKGILRSLNIEIPVMYQNQKLSSLDFNSLEPEKPNRD